MISFIIGNGSSRKTLNLEQLKPVGHLYGCNALYREYAPEYTLPDFLVAIDEGMIQEIEASDFPKDRVIIPPFEERWEPAECNPNRPRSNAGMNAMNEAIKRGSDTIVGLGFDFLYEDPLQSISNLFDGTPNYGPETRANHLDNPNRVKFLKWFVTRNPGVDFFFAYPDLDRPLRPMPLMNFFYTDFKDLEETIIKQRELGE